MTNENSAMAPVTMYSTRFCSYCMRARMLLESRQIPYHDISVDADPERRQEMMTKSGRRSVPQIWIGDKHIGGYDDLAALHNSGELDQLLGGE